MSVHCLLNAETRHLINEAFLRQMQPTACLINTSRGPVVDEQALIRALREGWIAGAALDVQEQEPPHPDHPLLRMDNVIVTPHAAYFSPPAVAQVPQRCGEEVARVRTGQRPLHGVNPEVYAAGWPLRSHSAWKDSVQKSRHGMMPLTLMHNTLKMGQERPSLAGAAAPQTVTQPLVACVLLS